MEDDWRSLCSTIEKRPDNLSIGELTNRLNSTSTTINREEKEEVIQRCGKYLSGMNLDPLFQSILKKGEENVLKEYLTSIEDLPEKQLIQSVNSSFDYLNVLLTKPFDYWSLTNSMKVHLNSDKSVDLAEQLVSRLVHFEPPTTTIVDWLCALIDAHFSSFVLAKWNRIDFIEQFLQDRLSTFDALQGLNTLKKTSTPANNNAGSTTTGAIKKSVDNLYTLQRIHFK